MIRLSPIAPRPKGKCRDIFSSITGKASPEKKKSNKKKKKKVK